MNIVWKECDKEGGNEHDRRHDEMEGGVAHRRLAIPHKPVQYSACRYEGHHVCDVRGSPVDAEAPVVCSSAWDGLPDEYLQGRVAHAVAKGVNDYWDNGDDVGRLEDHKHEGGEDLEAPGNKKDGLCPPPLAVEVREDCTYEDGAAAEDKGEPCSAVWGREQDVVADGINYEKEGKELEDRVADLLQDPDVEEYFDLFVLLKHVKIVRYNEPQLEL